MRLSDDRASDSTGSATNNCTGDRGTEEEAANQGADTGTEQATDADAGATIAGNEIGIVTGIGVADRGRANGDGRWGGGPGGSGDGGAADDAERKSSCDQGLGDVHCLILPESETSLEDRLDVAMIGAAAAAEYVERKRPRDSLISGCKIQRIAGIEGGGLVKFGVTPGRRVGAQSGDLVVHQGDER